MNWNFWDAEAALVSCASIKNDVEIWGLIYAPSATIEVYGDAVIYGAISAKRVDLYGSARVIYDSALRGD